MSYRVIILPTARRDLERLQKSIRRRVDNRILSLQEDPYRGALKLRGLGRFRVRVGDYRIIFEIQDSIRIVAVVAIPHRKDAYR